jgi:hypothetical protein
VQGSIAAVTSAGAGIDVKLGDNSIRHFTFTNQSTATFNGIPGKASELYPGMRVDVFYAVSLPNIATKVNAFPTLGRWSGNFRSVAHCAEMVFRGVSGLNARGSELVSSLSCSDPPESEAEDHWNAISDPEFHWGEGYAAHHKNHQALFIHIPLRHASAIPDGACKRAETEAEWAAESPKRSTARARRFTARAGQ